MASNIEPTSRIRKLTKSTLVGLVISLVLHIVILVTLSLIVFNGPLEQLNLVVDSVFSEERAQEEFAHEVEQTNDVATVINYVPGSVAAGITGTGGTAGPVVAQQKLDDASSLKEPDVKVNIAALSVPGLNIISKDLGTGQVSGETGRVVEGYGAALGQITQELIRLMRETKILVVWLFDESDSMKDDQMEIRERFYKVYDELGVVQKQDAKLKQSDETILTSVMSYGNKVAEHTSKITSNNTEIKHAIDNIKVDTSGLENMCAAVSAAVGKYSKIANAQKRRLVVIVVTDESGDDGDHVEETIQKCKSAGAPVYFLGHYSVFGYPYAHIRWIDPVYKLHHWIQINRGPETPHPECLQFDGLHGRWDVFPVDLALTNRYG